jgi:thiamine pyrophosphokinase
MDKNPQPGAAGRRCVIITARVEGAIKDALRLREDDFVVCADGGHTLAAAERIEPAVILGDFDSIGAPPRAAPGTRVFRYPAEKDDTDTMLALKHGFDAGFSDFVIVGGLSGRFDHSFANLQTASYCLDRGGRIRIVDGGNKAILTDDERFALPPEEGFFFSLFSWTKDCRGVDIENAKYNARNVRLTRSFPLGVSNEFADGPVTIRKKSGRLLIILSRKE